MIILRNNLEDLSLHILDIGENCIEAHASLIEILIHEDTQQNLLKLEIKDNGRGIDKNSQNKVKDPFYTTKTTRPVGLGLSLLEQAATEADGNITISSHVGKGTIITANFTHNHIDRKPLGDMSETLVALITGFGTELDIVYTHCKDGEEFLFDTREVKKELQEVPINTPEVLKHLKNIIKTGLAEIINKNP